MKIEYTANLPENQCKNASYGKNQTIDAPKPQSHKLALDFLKQRAYILPEARTNFRSFGAICSGGVCCLT